MLSREAGLATTVAVALHEIPQEFGDFGVLLHAGLPVKKALLLNGLSAATAFLGALAVLLTGNAVALEPVLVPVAAGGFLYVACADLVPELHRRARGVGLLPVALALAAGVLVVALLPLLLGHGHVHAHPEGGGHVHEHPAHD
jgi:zinc and cadmium transporter